MEEYNAGKFTNPLNKEIIKKIVFNLVNNGDLVLNDRDLKDKSNKIENIIINDFEHCSQVMLNYLPIEKQFIIVNFDIIFQDDSYSKYTWERIYKKTCSINVDMLEYLQFMREEKLRDLSITPEDKIRKSISEYLEFDSDELFKNKFNLIRIFGGAIRDIISEQPIHDIDILCGSKSIKFVESILESNGYHYIEMLNGKDLQEMYSEIHVINEPHTWIKGKKIVQLISPSLGFTDSTEAYRRGFSDLISNVDLSCCGVSYDGQTLHEDYPNSILHCQSKVFSVNKLAKMYSEKRISHRIQKMTDRGWKRIENTTSNNRDLKIEKIFN